MQKQLFFILGSLEAFGGSVSLSRVTLQCSEGVPATSPPLKLHFSASALQTANPGRESLHTIHDIQLRYNGGNGCSPADITYGTVTLLLEILRPQLFFGVQVFIFQAIWE